MISDDYKASVLKALRNDLEYYRGIGRQYLSNSDIGTLLSNPHMYGRYREDGKALAEGRYFHQLLLEPHKAVDIPYVDVSTRTTEKYRTYIKDNKLEYAMLLKEKQEIERLADTMKRNIVFFDEIYKDGNSYEEPMIGVIKGMQWKGKADILTNEFIIDLKTSSDINKFKYSAKAYNYDSQCYIYQQLFGRPLIFFVIDKLTGQLGIFRPTEEFVQGGEAKVEKAVAIYNKYFGDNPTDNISNHYIDETLV
ncbi:putative exonuclease [Caudoviricetes sp.]|nr:putative exonuclease [Caudoviricetes sp.]